MVILGSYKFELIVNKDMKKKINNNERNSNISSSISSNSNCQRIIKISVE